MGFFIFSRERKQQQNSSSFLHFPSSKSPSNQPAQFCYQGSPYFTHLQLRWLTETGTEGEEDEASNSSLDLKFTTAVPVASSSYTKPFCLSFLIDPLRRRIAISRSGEERIVAIAGKILISPFEPLCLDGEWSKRK